MVKIIRPLGGEIEIDIMTHNKPSGMVTLLVDMKLKGKNKSH